MDTFYPLFYIKCFYNKLPDWYTVLFKVICFKCYGPNESLLHKYRQNTMLEFWKCAWTKMCFGILSCWLEFPNRKWKPKYMLELERHNPTCNLGRLILNPRLYYSREISEQRGSVGDKFNRYFQLVKMQWVSEVKQNIEVGNREAAKAMIWCGCELPSQQLIWLKNMAVFKSKGISVPWRKRIWAV